MQFQCKCIYCTIFNKLKRDDCRSILYFAEHIVKLEVDWEDDENEMSTCVSGEKFDVG